MQLNFKIKKQQIRCTNTNSIVAGSANVILAKFIFEDEYWGNLMKTVTFINSNTGVRKKILLGTENSCTVPYEPMAENGLLNVYIEGFRDDVIVVTTMMRQPLQIISNGHIDSPSLSTPTPDIYQQIIANMVTRKDLDEFMLDKSGVFSAETHYDFPSIGNSQIIYKANQERKIYQWNSDALTYEPLSVFDGETDLEIEQIYGGSANG